MCFCQNALPLLLNRYRSALRHCTLRIACRAERARHSALHYRGARNKRTKIQPNFLRLPALDADLPALYANLQRRTVVMTTIGNRQGIYPYGQPAADMFNVCCSFSLFLLYCDSSLLRLVRTQHNRKFYSDFCSYQFKSNRSVGSALTAAAA